MKMRYALTMIAVAGCIGVANGTIIDFEGVAPSGGTTTLNAQNHIEDGYALNVSHGHHISSTVAIGSYNNHTVQNGTDWLLLDNTGANILTALDNSLFSINAVDIMSSFDGQTVTGNIIGTFANDSTISVFVNYTTILSTYSFSSDWSGLKSVNFTGTNNYKTIDNIVVEAIPEPATLGLMGLSTLGLLFRRRRSRTCLLTGAIARRDSVDLASTKKAESSVGYVNAIKPYMNSKKRAKVHAETKWVNY